MLLALLATTAAWAWAPTAQAGLLPFAQKPLLATGSYASCATTSSARVMCWGRGFGTRPTEIGGSLSPQILTTPITSLSAGASQACAVRSEQVHCWGYDANSRPTATPVSGINDAVSVSVGDAFACALLRSSTVACWGTNDRGQLGDGTTVSRTEPAPVVGLSDVIAMDAGWNHTCAVLRSGTVKCWGWNAHFNLGLGGDWTGPNPVPQTAGTVGSPLENAVQLSAGLQSSCVIRTDQTVSCWGYNDNNRQWLGGPMIAGKPIVDVPGVSGATSVTAGHAFQCAASRDGTARCWGLNQLGQLGRGDTVSDGTPARVSGLTGVTVIAGGLQHACARTASDIYCWGENYAGELGDGTMTRSSTPVKVAAPVPWGDPEVDGVIPTQGPFTEISATKDLRCGRNTQVGTVPPFLTPDGCGTWVATGESLIGPDDRRMQPAWPHAATAWEPLEQTESGSGSADDPWEITTTVTGGSVVVEQTDRYVDGSSKTTTSIRVTNMTPLAKHVVVYAAGDCIHRDESGGYDTSGFGFRPIVDDGASGCSEKQYDGTALAWESAHPRARTTANTLDDIAGQISSLGGFDLGCRCSSGIDDAAGVSWSSDLEPGGSETFSYELSVGAGNPPGDGPWNMRAIRAAAAWNAGPKPITGAGQSVAIVDTGVDPDAPWFGDGPSGKIPKEACWSSEITAPYRIGPITVRKPSELAGTCWREGARPLPEWLGRLGGADGDQLNSPAYGLTTAGHFSGPETARPKANPCRPMGTASCGLTEIDWGIDDRFFQGTFVAGLAAGDNPDGVGGVAPKAKIVAANVSSWKLGPWRGTPRASAPGNTIIANPNDAAQALNWIGRMRTTRKIAAVNLMLPGHLTGSGTFSSGTCEGQSPNLEQAIKTLVRANISVVVAAGDDGRKSELPWPACLPDVISVGATDSRDRVWQKSNSSRQLTLLAPGVRVESALIKSDDLTERSGTFAAAAHVTGAIAAYKQKYPNATSKQVREALIGTSTQPSITDTNGITTPFLRVDKMLDFKPVG